MQVTTSYKVKIIGFNKIFEDTLNIYRAALEYLINIVNIELAGVSVKIPACTKGLFSLVNSVFAGSKSHFLHDIGLRQSENSAKNSYFSFVEGITDPLCKRGF